MEVLTTAKRLIKMRSRGQLTIPLDLREALHLTDETPLNVFTIGNVLVMTPKRLQRAPLAAEVEREMRRQGLTLEDLLKDLREQRERYLAEADVED